MGFKSKDIIKSMDAVIADPAQVVELAEEYTLKNILADKKRNYLFGELLEQEKNGDELAEKLRAKPEELSSEDLQSIEKVHIDFVERLEGVKKLRESLTLEIFQEIANRSSELMQQVNLGGAEKTREVILGQMEVLAMQKDQTHFEELKNTFTEQGRTDSSIKENDRRITEYSDKNNINVYELQEAFMLPVYEDRQKAIEKVVNNGLRWYQFSWFKTGKKMEELEEERRNIRILGDQSSQALKDVAKSLAVTLSKNDDVRLSLVEAITGSEKKSEVEGSSFAGAGKDLVSEEEVQVALDEYKTKHPRKTSEKNDDVLYQSRIQDDFAKEFMATRTSKKVGKKGNVWSRIAESFMSGLFDKLSY